jgi:outer membrane receptor protein involved in Fe transport
MFGIDLILKLRNRIVSISLLMSLVLSGSAYAQSATATLSGIATDSQGAVVSGASVTLTNPATRQQRQTTTNDDGSFVFSQLPPSAYVLDLKHAGFVSTQLPDVVLNVGDQRTLRIELKVAQVAETVTVSTDAPLIKDSPAVATVVTRGFVANQPLNGRSFLPLVELSPGVVLSSGEVGSQSEFSVNGQRAGTNYFTVDGVSANFGVANSANLYQSGGGGAVALSALGTTNTLASIDAVQEFSIQTSTYAPEFGRQPGAQVAVVTRSGTNDLHGNVFDYLRNDVFDANDFFANRAGLKRPALRQNDFGFTLGGPVFLPSFGLGGKQLYNGRDRTFFFVSYEGLRLRRPLTSAPTLVPTVAARQAATGYARDLLNAYPLPNGPATAADPNVATFIASYTAPSTINAASVRFDHSLNDRISLFGRYNYAPSSSQLRGNFTSLNSIEISDFKTETLTAGATFLFSPRVSDDLRVNFSRAKGGARYELDDFGGAIVPSATFFFPSLGASDSSISAIFVGSLAAPFSGINSANQQRQFNIVNNLSSTFGSHALKFGVDYRRLMPINSIGDFRRVTIFNNIAQVNAGIVGLLSFTATSGDLHPIYNNYALFAQDTWRATPRLTLTYGLRYDLNPAPRESNGNDPYTVVGLETPATATLAPPGTRLYETTKNAFAPRVGVAYQLFQSSARTTIVRGGFGVFYDLGTAFTGQIFLPSFYPYGRELRATNFPLTSPIFIAAPPAFAVNPPYGRLFAYDSDYRLPYTLQYNVAIEQAFGANNTVSATYVGANGRRLGRVESLRNPSAGLPAAFTTVDVTRNEAESDYHALQLQYQRRMSRGIQALASYSFSKSLDNASDESGNNLQAPVARYDTRRDRGPSVFDVRHAFSAAVSYELPSPFDSGVGRALLGGFAIDSIFRTRSALPVNVTTGTDTLGFGFAGVARPNLVSGVPLYLDDANAPGGRRINRAAFIVPAAGTQGTLRRNALRGFPLWQLDMSLRRQFNVAEGTNLQLKIDAFNIFNHANFANPPGTLTDANFGLATQMFGRTIRGSSPLYQVGGPRSLQLALKLNF